MNARYDFPDSGPSGDIFPLTDGRVRQTSGPSPWGLQPFFFGSQAAGRRAFRCVGPFDPPALAVNSTPRRWRKDLLFGLFLYLLLSPAGQLLMPLLVKSSQQPR